MARGGGTPPRGDKGTTLPVLLLKVGLLLRQEGIAQPDSQVGPLHVLEIVNVGRGSPYSLNGPVVDLLVFIWQV